MPLSGQWGNSHLTLSALLWYAGTSDIERREDCSEFVLCFSFPRRDWGGPSGPPGVAPPAQPKADHRPHAKSRSQPDRPKRPSQRPQGRGEGARPTTTATTPPRRGGQKQRKKSQQNKNFVDLRGDSFVSGYN